MRHQCHRLTITSIELDRNKGNEWTKVLSIEKSSKVDHQLKFCQITSPDLFRNNLRILMCLQVLLVSQVFEIWEQTIWSLQIMIVLLEKKKSYSKETDAKEQRPKFKRPTSLQAIRNLCSLTFWKESARLRWNISVRKLLRLMNLLRFLTTFMRTWLKVFVHLQTNQVRESMHELSS